MTAALVTGGLGFIGRHVVDRLVEDGVSVHIVDSLESRHPGSRPGESRSEETRRVLARWPPEAAVTCEIISVADFTRRGDADRFDEIYHLASVVGPVGVLPYAGQIARRIIDDVYHVRALCRSSARLCYVSTSEVYGGGRGGACAEHDDRVVPAASSARAEYGAAKLAAEVALTNAAQSESLPAVIVRPFNVAGPGQSPDGGFVVPRFVQQALADEPITVYGTGQAVRAFAHVVDVADGIVRATRIGEAGQAYNLGRAENRTTILGLAELVVRVTGSRSRILHIDPRDLYGPAFAEVGDKYPDGDRAQRELGWRPSRDLETILHDAVAWERARTA